MLSKILINNFQSLNNCELDIGKFTVIVGESESGKSAVIRAIDSMINNNPVYGADWSSLPPGASRCSMSLFLDKGTVIDWVKGKTDNMYVLNGDAFKKVGKVCPPEILEVLRMGNFVIDGFSYNASIHKQFELPFLLADGGSKVSKIIGRITNMHLITSANKLTLQEKSFISRKLTSINENLERESKALEKFKDLEDKKTRAEILKSLLRDIKDKESLVSQLNVFITSLKSCFEKRVSLDTRINYHSMVCNLETSVFNSNCVLETINKLRIIYLEIVNRHARDQILVKYSKLENVKPVSIELYVALNNALVSIRKYRERNFVLDSALHFSDALTGVGTLIDKAIKLNGQFGIMSDAISRYRAMALKYNTACRNYHSASEQNKQALEALSTYIELNPLCPTCGAELNSEEVCK